MLDRITSHYIAKARRRHCGGRLIRIIRRVGARRAPSVTYRIIIRDGRAV